MQRKLDGQCANLPPNNYVQIIETEASIRCGLTLSTIYELVVELCQIVLQQDHKVIIVWPFKHIRRYGYTNNSFSIEAGSKSVTGEGLFIFRSTQSVRLYNQTIANVTKLKQLKMRQLMQRPFDTLQVADKTHSAVNERYAQSCELVKSLDQDKQSSCSTTIPHYVRNNCEYAQVVKQSLEWGSSLSADAQSVVDINTTPSC